MSEPSQQSSRRAFEEILERFRRANDVTAEMKTLSDRLREEIRSGGATGSELLDACIERGYLGSTGGIDTLLELMAYDGGLKDLVGQPALSVVWKQGIPAVLSSDPRENRFSVDRHVHVGTIAEERIAIDASDLGWPFRVAIRQLPATADAAMKLVPVPISSSEIGGYGIQASDGDPVTEGHLLLVGATNIKEAVDAATDAEVYLKILAALRRAGFRNADGDWTF